MNDRIRKAFDEVHAEEALKQRTRAAMTRQITMRQGRSGGMGWSCRRWAVVFSCCFLLLMVGGLHALLTPVSAISVDVNPSLELSINRFNQVVSVKGYNEDGRRLASSLSLRFVNYQKALDEILETETIRAFLERDEIVSITVLGRTEEASQEMMERVQACTSNGCKAAGSVYCYSGNSQEAHEAHQAGLSFGKYRAFLELQGVAPEVTVEEVQGLTMHEIREQIEAHSEHEPEGEEGEQAHESGEAPADRKKGHSHRQGGCD